MNAKRRSVVAILVIAVAVTAAFLPLSCRRAAGPQASVGEPADANVVARIGDYEITRRDVIQRLAMEIRPHREESTGPQEPVTAEAVLLDLISEKALILEGRKLGALNDPTILSYVDRQKRQKLGSAAVLDYMRQNLTVSDAEIDEVMKSQPNMSREQVSAQVQRAKGMPLLEQFTQQLFTKFHYRPLKENFASAARIHDRLLHRPAQTRRESWILNSQMRDELTQEEKDLVLATYDGGKVTLRDWFETLGDIVPPRRPQNLNTAEGVEQLLDRTSRGAILVAEAKARGYDKNPQYLREIRDLEDQQILYKVQSDKVRDIPEPNAAQIEAFYERNKDWFVEGPFLNVDQIWCKDLAAAQEARRTLDGGADFRSVKETYSLQKNVEPYNIYRGGEGPFWEDLWKGEPNQVVGPVKGFYEQGLAWRVVRILEKTPAKTRPYSDQIHDTVKWTMLAEQRKARLDLYYKELREKYQYELYTDRIEGIDPLDPAVYEQLKR
ncbi:MAG: peptidyl-prolyl cis-trans isomerase [Sedimentisphaerales bacterium]|nr:peptidyl-prolyl cis-trans isomerase [Sedimentisphaerales bacterium]